MECRPRGRGQCQDPPQIYDMRLLRRLRAAHCDRALAERERRSLDLRLFSIEEYCGMPSDQLLDQCVAWPASTASHLASQDVAVGAAYPDVPALVISANSTT